MTTWAIGDIQGCYDALRRLLDQCRFDPAKDQIWLVGDLVNRGPQSLETLRFIRALGKSAVTVLGNHDLYLLMVAADAVPRRGKDDTLDPIFAAPDVVELLDWLKAQPLVHSAMLGGQRHLMVHAGLLPGWSADDAIALSQEVSAQLKGPQFANFLHALWGDTPLAWDPALSADERSRVIVNAMTRMRFCSAAGVMDLKIKGKPENAPGGHHPWFEVPKRKTADDVLVVGHWSALGLKMTPNLVALDSGCLWGGHLTAVSLPERRVEQVACTTCASS
ncbi:MAG: bis(5-nucleosyl)-tetraphosphatase, symmetrical [Pseudomonadota bacterium]|jgi:bis(5'-nucleosyl)-tetraphosphatase (symmetrical)